MTEEFRQFGMLNGAPAIPLAPLVGALIAGVAGPKLLRGASHWPVIVGVTIALLLSGIVLGVFVCMDPGHTDRFAHPYVLYQWIAPDAQLWFDVSLRLDPLTAIMLVTVCSVSLLVLIFSRDYMREHGQPERGYERFFAFLGLFVFSMCVLVLAGNFLLLYLGWEAVGLCSYLLIGFYYQRPAAAAAARKAFLVNRIGDFGFGLGILFIYLWISPLVEPGRNPLDYGVVFEKVGQLTTDQCTVIALLLFCGAIGKSAQLPLHVWLPDAMEGPTPVSALIHAATMVTAGVYMVARCGEIFTRSPAAMTVVAVVGAASALFAGFIALTQYDMKRILAYSTISQLGYMFLGLGVYAANAAVFHLFTHAFFKALLFLGAGSVMHALAGTIDLRQFGGLRRRMPVTYVTFLIGGLALAGFPFVSGFFSKDEIIHISLAASTPLGAVALFGELLTAFYTFRMVFLAFHGPERVPEGVHVHESPVWMLIPLVLLSVGALIAGYVDVDLEPGGFCGLIELNGWLCRFLDPTFRPFCNVAAHSPHELGHGLTYFSTILSLAGIVLAYVVYVRHRNWAERAATTLAPVQKLLYRKFYVDECYDAIVVRPLRRLSRVLYGADVHVIDGLVRAVVFVPRAFGASWRHLQTGAVQDYGMTMMAGLALLVIVLLMVI